MKETKIFKKSTWQLIIKGILALGTLGLSLALVRTVINRNIDVEDMSAVIIEYPVIQPIGFLLFILLAIFHLVQFSMSESKKRSEFIRQMVYVLFSLCAGALILVRGGMQVVWPLAATIFFLANFIASFLAFMQKRSRWNTCLLVLSLLVLFFGVVTMQVVWIGDPEEKLYSVLLSLFTLFFLVDAQGVASIIPIAFSSVRLDILRRIIRKTYALEILSGIILLIIAFSFILPAFEDNISTFGDALWYCFAIVTTIGFGDLTATSVVGRIMSVVLGIYGIIVVALITSIIVNFYGEMKKEEPDDAEAGHSTGSGADDKKAEAAEAPSDEHR